MSKKYKSLRSQGRTIGKLYIHALGDVVTFRQGEEADFVSELRGCLNDFGPNGVSYKVRNNCWDLSYDLACVYANIFGYGPGDEGFPTKDEFIAQRKEKMEKGRVNENQL